MTFGSRNKRTGESTDVTNRESGRAVAMPICNSCGKKLADMATERGIDVISTGDDYSEETREASKSLISIFKEDELTEDEQKEIDIKDIQNQAAKVIAEDKKRLENPMVQNMYKSLESMFKKKEEKNEGNVNSEQGTKEPDTECKWCKKDPNSDKKQWQRDAADKWTKFFGGNKTVGEWFGLNVHGLDSETAGKHDKNPDLYHKLHANIPKEKKEMRETPQAVGETGLPPTPEFETNYTNAMNAAADKLRGRRRRRKSLESMFKAEENMFGAGQRGLGFGNEGYTNVQGSGQNHTISEIPPEMEIIVHDVNEIKEVEKEGYTTEAGNAKAGDPSRATDDDDSLLSPKYI